MSKRKKKLLLATGGSGGHLFPAQAIAKEVLANEPDAEVLFAGAGLKTNRYFDREKFRCVQVSSTTIFRQNVFGLVCAPFRLFKGLCEAVMLVRSYRPDVVVGFGSFHSLPVLVAAKLYRAKLVLFEANAIPGRVNRLCARWAKWCAIYFPDAARRLKTQTYLTSMPFWSGRLQQCEKVTRDQARAYLGLKKDRRTLLVFGGSQGARSINRMVSEAMTEMHIDRSHIQLLHITGSSTAAQEMRKLYSKLGIEAVVKDFEHHMHLVWPGVDLAICRAGAGSIAEQINYEVPSILIPYPHAASNHQHHNGRFMAETVRGGTILAEKKLSNVLLDLLATESNQLANMQESISTYKKITKRESLSHLILEELRCATT